MSQNDESNRDRGQLKEGDETMTERGGDDTAFSTAGTSTEHASASSSSVNEQADLNRAMRCLLSGGGRADSEGLAKRMPNAAREVR